MNTQAWVTLYRFDTFEEAIGAQSYLESEGVETNVVDERKEFSKSASAVENMVLLQVRLESSHEAHKLLLAAGLIVEPGNEVYFGEEILSLKSKIQYSSIPKIAIGLLLVLLIMAAIALFF